MRTPSCLALTLLLPILAHAKDLELDNRTSVRFTQVTGAGRAASFYRNGTFLIEEPALLYRKSLNEAWKAGVEFRPRLTNDQLTDKKGMSVETLSGEVKSSSHVFSLGDYFAVMSQYSMGQLLKGGAYQRNFRDEENYVRVAAGSFDTQWEFLYREDPTEPMDRFGGGARAQLSREKFRLGLNYALVQDDKDDPMRRLNQDTAYRQDVGAFDWEYRLGLFTLDGEHAAALTHTSPYGAAEVQTHGHANRFRLQGTPWGARLLAQFENVSPNFVPLAGSASQDRRRYTLQLSRRLAKVWQAFAKFSLSHDNLEGQQLRTRTTNTNYDLGATRSKLFGRKELESSLSWRRSQTDTRNFTRDRTADRLQLSVSDQLTKTVRGRLLFEPSFDRDHARNTHAVNYLYEVRLSDRRRLPKSWTMNSTLSGRRRETENIVSMGYDLQTGGNARIDFSKPGGLQTGAELDFTDMNLYTGMDSRTTRARAFVGMKPKWPADSTVDLAYDLVHYGFSDANKEYAEHLVKLNWNWRL